MSSWILYGLGTENQNLPGFLTIRPHVGHSGVRNWSTAFLPGAYQGTPVGVSRGKLEELQKEPIENLLNKGLSTEQQRYELDMLRNVSPAAGGVEQIR